MGENDFGNSVYEFGFFRLDVADYLLTCDRGPISLQPKVFELLVVLLEHRGHTIEKNTLMQTLWPHAFVEESNLTQLIHQLRRALGESASTPQYIETIPKRGYRFIADVAECPRTSTEVIIRSQATTQILIDQVEGVDGQVSDRKTSRKSPAVANQNRMGRARTAVGPGAKTIGVLVAGAAATFILVVCVTSWFCKLSNANSRSDLIRI